MVVIKTHSKIEDDLRKISAQDGKRILKKIKTLNNENYRALLQPCAGPLAGLYRMRIGNYRAVCAINSDMSITILVIKIASRGDVYESRSIAEVVSRTAAEI